MLYASDTPAMIKKQYYRYMLRSQRQWNILAKYIGEYPGDLELLYNPIFRFTNSQSVFNTRLLAIGFDPRNDQYRLTLHTFIAS